MTAVHGDDASARGDHRRRGARTRCSTVRGDLLTLALDTHEYGTSTGGATDQMAAGKSSGDEVVRRHATGHGGIYGYAAS